MAFPQTRLSLIQRLAGGGSEQDWRVFLADYWGPVCRFALRWGARHLDDAEDVAARTFEVLWEGRLLVRWASNRSAKLRTLLCCVVRNILSDRNRVQANRDRLLRQLAQQQDPRDQVPDEQAGAFYVAWVEDLVQRLVESLADEYYRQNKDDYVRVLYGRICRRMTIAEVAQSLEISTSAVDNYFRHARRRLAEKLEELLRRQVGRYCSPEQAEQELAGEWQQLGAYLAEHGGLEEAIRRAYQSLDPIQAGRHRREALAKAAGGLSVMLGAANRRDEPRGSPPRVPPAPG